MPSKPAPRLRLAFTRGEAQRLHKEIGDIPRSQVGPKLWAFYRELDHLLELEWTPENLERATRKKQQRRGVAPKSPSRKGKHV